MIKEWLAVAIGGAIGASMRHAINIAFVSSGLSWLPIATLVANLVGCFSIGALAQWSLQEDASSNWWVTGARVGLLGGLTTFSSFALEIFKLWEAEKMSWSLSLTAAHVVIGILSVWLGVQAIKGFS